ncbi:hypothetical protein PHSY_000490 [Pseudozyma hubeiensis SY62]|uniref:Uncharacterized protein n=1 Tax=Pseudozyma hubeiensis (strain SY62) TaxID=1305764 RepID=R9NWP1_PSEHS|nr:hypothetical protein PHSY_000490 [Pseudozyma hubeiensis SY62]GAC92931.1 hypothetical protein PHSY_000490 [Pseudozyma hubeiensis SY62]
MWAGASSGWRKRQQNTKARLGINVERPNPLSDPSGSTLASQGSIIDSVDSLLVTKRQTNDETAGEIEDQGALEALTYNNGMWTTPAAASIASPTPPALTATVPVAPMASLTDLDSESNTISASAVSTDAASLTSTTAARPTSVTPLPSSSSLTGTSSSSSSSTSATPSPTDKAHSNAHSGSGGFQLIYLTPILVFVGLFLLFSVGGRMWGRYQHASRVEAARRAQYDKRASRQAKKREMQRIKTMWGYDQTPILPPELAPGEHDLHYKDPSAPSSKKSRSALSGQGEADSSFGSDSESGASGKSSEIDDRYPGTFKILSLALLGEGSKSGPPETRGEGGRKYETGVQSNGWIATKIRRWVGADEKDMTIDDERYTAAPYKAGARRIRHALSRDQLRGSGADEEYNEKDLHSPTTTLSVGSGEMKTKERFGSIDLTTQYQPNTYYGLGHNYNQTGTDDPFLTTSNDGVVPGWKKPLPPQPKESPFRPAILNFGLRSRSKQYDPIDPTNEADTPVKRALLQQDHADEAGGFLPKTFGLGISGVWKTITGMANPAAADAARVPTEDDEESFVGRPYQAHSDAMMSESDTPYSTRDVHSSHGYIEAGTPTKSRQLGRAGTVLNVKSTNQPWNAYQREQNVTPQSAAKKMTGAAWHEALLASPPNKQQQQVFQPFVQTTSPSPTRPAKHHNLAPRKSLLLHQAVASAAAAADSNLANATSPAQSSTGYSDLVACYSTPSDAVQSPAEDVMSPASIRVLCPPVAVRTDATLTEESLGARQKLQRAKTAKYANDGRGYEREGDGGSTMAGRPIQRSKTASTDASAARSEARVSRKGTVHHSMRPVASRAPSVETQETQGSEQTSSALYPSTFTQPLRVSKQPPPITSPASCYSSASSPSRGSVSIPARASSTSPSKPSPSTFPGSRTSTNLPSALRIASPEPLSSHHAQHQPLALPLLSHPHYRPESSASPPKRTKAVSNRSNASANEEDDIDELSAANHVAAAARSAALKAHNRTTALQTVDAIVYQGYAQHR